MKRNYLIYILLCILFLSTSSCKDDLLYGGEAGEGKCVISGTVKFKSFTPALNGSTRTAGDAIKEISSLCVLLYDANTENPGQSKLVNKYFLKPEGDSGTSGVDGYYEVTPVNREDHTNQDYTNSEGNFLSPAEAETPRATFKLTVPYGNYYIYAVANMSDLSSHVSDIQTVDGLKSISLQWSTGDITANSQMFGHFFSTDNTSIDAPLLTINRPNEPLKAWVRRAASKVTVAYDGSQLEDGVSIYIKSVTVKNIPSVCYLGKNSKIVTNSQNENENYGSLIETGECIKYSDSDSYQSWPEITNNTPYYYYINKGNPTSPISKTEYESKKDEYVQNAHAETNEALFFYENMQGEGPDKRQSDTAGDGNLDEKYDYRQMPCATYIEVKTYYESTNPDHPGMCNITYRFMLGQDIIKDYNARRNCHYKLTLHFNGFADDPDWRIDYVTRFWVTQPETVDYRGKYFAPDGVTTNQGNTFEDNVITVTSFMYDIDDWEKRNPMRYKIEYGDVDGSSFDEECPDWLAGFEEVSNSNGEVKLKIKYKNEYEPVDINEKLRSNAPKPDYDLATKGGSEKENTANCYIVDSQGTYKFPLVYGNAITDGSENTDSYTYRGWLNAGSADKYLSTFKNYEDKEIKSAYILKDIYGDGAIPNNLSASLVWQDVNGLVTNIQYNKNAYNKGDAYKNGGIQFDVNVSTIMEGNAVIALKDPNGKIMWSWHIWVTAMDFSKTIILNRPQIDNNIDNLHLSKRNFEIMPVNLGWCSGGTPIRYYARHECEVKFTQLLNEEEEPEQRGMSRIVKIIQEPHIALPQGNNPYFQWGRKDPFVAGIDGNNKTWYTATGSSASAPTLMYDSEETRVKTYEATASLIQNPDKWQNGPRRSPGDWGNPYRPDDIVFANLWDNSWPLGVDQYDFVMKTIYDPCPAGYHVSSLYTFSGFTAGGNSITHVAGDPEKDIDNHMYAATEDNMMPADNDPDYLKYRDGIFEFYTNTSKLISIGFPLNGYRDWDADANLITFFTHGQIWHAQAAIWAEGYDVDGKKEGRIFYNAYHFEYNRYDHIFPWNNFYATDGFPVRPTRTLTE